MKKLSILLAALLLLSGCGNAGAGEIAPTTEPREAYMNITQEEAKNLMDTQENYIILDVRRQDEYAEKHIPGAILIPHDEIEERAEKELPDKDQLILVYCRSGNRSKQASEVLERLGYTRIREFGGINTWPYETE